MTGPGEKDIIDAAMEADDYDYGDKETDVGTEGSFPEEPSTPEKVVSPTTPDQPVPTQKEPTVPQTVADPNNPLGLKRVGAQFADGKGNIVDRDGKIVARAGESARLWQEASRANAQVQNLQRQNSKLAQDMDGQRQLIAQAREIAELPSKLGISREDYTESMTLLSNWNRDPVGVARDIVARVLALGYNVTDIVGKTAGDALEMKAVSRLVKDATAPLIKQQQTTDAVTANDAKAQAAHDKFIGDYEHAEVHGDAIARLMERGAPPVDAYYQIKMFALQNNLDFTQPLGPQVMALKARQQGQRPTERRPLNPGNGRGNESQLTTQPDMADATDDWGSIIRGVMSQ